MLFKIDSVYVHSLHDNQVKTSSRNYASAHECCSTQPLHRHLLSYSKLIHNQTNSHSRHYQTPLINNRNIHKQCLTTNYNTNHNQENFYLSRSLLHQNSYPYKLINKNYECNQLLYASLSDFINRNNSAFKPVKFRQHSHCHTSEEISPSNDPCDLEVAQYFRQTPRSNNSNYFDIYTDNMLVALLKKNCSETLC